MITVVTVVSISSSKLVIHSYTTEVTNIKFTNNDNDIFITAEKAYGTVSYIIIAIYFVKRSGYPTQDILRPEN